MCPITGQNHVIGGNGAQRTQYDRSSRTIGALLRPMMNFLLKFEQCYLKLYFLWINLSRLMKNPQDLKSQRCHEDSFFVQSWSTKAESKYIGQISLYPQLQYDL